MGGVYVIHAGGEHIRCTADELRPSTSPHEPGDALTVTTWSGNQPPRRETSYAVVVEPCADGAWIRYEDGPRAGRQTRVSCTWLARHARRPLDPTPPGPLPAGEQPTLFDLLEATP
jgi:hypothetical protein